MMVQALTMDERATLAGDLPGWTVMDERDAIMREFRFADFSAAWAS